MRDSTENSFSLQLSKILRLDTYLLTLSTHIGVKQTVHTYVCKIRHSILLNFSYIATNSAHPPPSVSLCLTVHGTVFFALLVCFSGIHFLKNNILNLKLYTY